MAILSVAMLLAAARGNSGSVLGSAAVAPEGGRMRPVVFLLLVLSERPACNEAGRR